MVGCTLYQTWSKGECLCSTTMNSSVSSQGSSFNYQRVWTHVDYVNQNVKPFLQNCVIKIVFKQILKLFEQDFNFHSVFFIVKHKLLDIRDISRCIFSNVNNSDKVIIILILFVHEKAYNNASLNCLNRTEHDKVT